MSKLKISINYRMCADKDYKKRMLWSVWIQNGMYGTYSVFTCKPTRKQIRKMVKFCNAHNWGKEFKK